MPHVIVKNPVASRQSVEKKKSVNDSGTKNDGHKKVWGDDHYRGSVPSFKKIDKSMLSFSTAATRFPHRQGMPRQSTTSTNMSYRKKSMRDETDEKGPDVDSHRGDKNAEKKKSPFEKKMEYVISKVRAVVSRLDIFTAKSESPPFVVCLKASVWFIPVLLIVTLWDTFAILVFEIPEHSWIDYPGFLLGWHFVMMMLAMYGFMLSYLSSGSSPRTKLAAISFVIHYLLLLYRIFMEFYFDGFRGQHKLYIERQLKRW